MCLRDHAPQVSLGTVPPCWAGGDRPDEEGAMCRRIVSWLIDEILDRDAPPGGLERAELEVAEDA